MAIATGITASIFLIVLVSDLVSGEGWGWAHVLMVFSQAGLTILLVRQYRQARAEKGFGETR